MRRRASQGVKIGRISTGKGAVSRVRFAQQKSGTAWRGRGAATALGGARRDASRRGGDTGAAAGIAPRCRAGAGNVRKLKRPCLAVQARRRRDGRWGASAGGSSVRRLLLFSRVLQRNKRDCFSLERRRFCRGGACGALSSPRICAAMALAIGLRRILPSVPCAAAGWPTPWRTLHARPSPCRPARGTLRRR
jgi:hypothetical protein